MKSCYYYKKGTEIALTPPKAEQEKYRPFCEDDQTHCSTCGYQCHNCGYELSPPPRITKVGTQVLDDLEKGSSVKEIAASHTGQNRTAIKLHITPAGIGISTLNSRITRCGWRLGGPASFRIWAGSRVVKAGRALD